MGTRLATILFVFLGINCPQANASPLPAFPGAQGYGACTAGGRGGSVFEVTNLNDSGPGSFRAACLATGPRTIVFRISGNIFLLSRITLRAANSHLTIAGQTAPGDGVQVTGEDVFFHGTHDVIIRYMRFRPNDYGANDWQHSNGEQKNALSFYGDSAGNAVFNVVIDHCSIYWGAKNTAFCWDHVHDITWQWCITEGKEHDFQPVHFEPGKSYLIGTDPGNGAHLSNVTLHHCYMVHSAQRNPLLCGDGPHQLINNLVYDWQDFGTNIQNRGHGTAVNLIGNYYRRGPLTRPDRYAVGLDHSPQNPDSYVYVRDNIGPFRPDSSFPEWAIVGAGYDERHYWTVPAPQSLQRMTPWPDPPIPVTISPSSQVPKEVLASAGATLPHRDALDQRMVNDYYNAEGQLLRASQQNPSWWPILRAGKPPVSSLHDGIPDRWKMARGLSTTAPTVAKQVNGDGYTNLEEYLNEAASQDTAASLYQPKSP